MRHLTTMVTTLVLGALLLNGCTVPSIRLETPAATAPEATANPPAALSGADTNDTTAIPATSVKLDGPKGLAIDAAGNLYVSQCTFSPQNQIFKVDEAGMLMIFAGKGLEGYSGDGGPATAALLDCPISLAVDPSGGLYVSDLINNRIRYIDASGTITTVVGSGAAGHKTGGFAGDDGPAIMAILHEPTSIALDSDANLYIADGGNNRVRKVDPNGTITTVAGTGEQGFSGDGGPATEAMLSLPNAFAVDSMGNLYIIDSGNQRIRKIEPGGTITTIVGNGEAGFSGDGGPATAARLSFPTALAFDMDDNLYIADNSNHRVRRVDGAGIIVTVVGTGQAGFSGDGQAADKARLNSPEAMAFDAVGNFYLIDRGNSRIRKIDHEGVITTVVGGEK